MERYGLSWQRKDMYTFVKVQPGTDAGKLEGKFSQIVEKYNPDLKERNQRVVLSLQPGPARTEASPTRLGLLADSGYVF